MTDAELVCLAVAQAHLGCVSERRQLRAAPKLVGHLFPRLLSKSWPVSLFTECMSDDESQLRGSWEVYLQAARDFDAGCRGDDTWPPPIMTALVTAVQATTLRRLHPFTSHARLCLSAGPRCWEPGAVNAPAFVSLEPPGLYNVWSGKPYRDAATVVFTTQDAELAASEFERLLTGWSAAGL